MAKKGGWKWSAYKRNKHKVRMKEAYAKKAQKKMLQRAGELADRGMEAAEQIHIGSNFAAIPSPALEHHFGPGCIINITHAVFNNAGFNNANRN